jgi:pheromone shutdown protein TraB
MILRVQNFSMAPEMVLAEKLLNETDTPVIRADRDPVLTLRRMVPFMSWTDKLTTSTRIISSKLFGAVTVEQQRQLLSQIDFHKVWKETTQKKGAFNGTLIHIGILLSLWPWAYGPVRRVSCPSH